MGIVPALRFSAPFQFHFFLLKRLHFLKGVDPSLLSPHGQSTMLYGLCAEWREAWSVSVKRKARSCRFERRVVARRDWSQFLATGKQGSASFKHRNVFADFMYSLPVHVHLQRDVRTLCRQSTQNSRKVGFTVNTYSQPQARQQLTQSYLQTAFEHYVLAPKVYPKRAVSRSAIKVSTYIVYHDHVDLPTQCRNLLIPRALTQALFCIES